ncbi:MAG TPA: sensor domain-containing diguanylate cyclase [Solirubrobacteraceae bacterium]|nr:sensor domain-containing diguanylate cyclase [Solirubrobacteraceae bacterium]
MSTSASTTTANATELVPIADRLRYLQAFRFLLAAVVGFAAWVERDSLTAEPRALVVVTAVYLMGSLTVHGLWLLARRAGLAVFGLLLIADGVYLAWSSWATGGSTSPVRYLIILHLIAVALLASHRTGMKLALWHSLLLLVVRYAQQADVLGSPQGEEASMEQLLAFSVVFWFVAVVTASFSAVNERELRRRRYDLEALAGMARRLEQASGSTPVAEVLVDHVRETFDVERAAVLASPDGSPLSVLAHRGDVHVEVTVEPGEGSAIAGAMRTRVTRLVSHLDEEADAALAAALPDARNVVIVPLSAEGQAIGALVLEHPMRAGTRIERRIVGMLERFAAHGALALRNAWLLEQVQHLAATDSLTGLPNRETFQRSLSQEVARAARTGGEMSVLLLDLDHFKRINDTLGHQAGDAVLRAVAAVLDESCRPFDTPARYGGEEFAVVLPNTGEADGRAAAERLRAAVGESAIDPAVTVSIGLASYPADGRDGDTLVRAADEALYASKRGGRNRVTSARASRLAA